MCKSKWLRLMLDAEKLREEPNSEWLLPRLGDISTQEQIKRGGRFEFSLLTWHSRRVATPLREAWKASKQNPISPHPPQSEFGIRSKTLSAAVAAGSARAARKPSNPLRSVNDTVFGRLGSAADGKKGGLWGGLRLGRGGTLRWEDGETSSKQLSHVLGVEG